MRFKYAYCSPLTWITLSMFIVVACATRDSFAAFMIFAGLCLSLIVLLPLAAFIRYVCLRCDVSRLPRRIAMMLPIIVVSCWVFSWTNSFGGYQRGLLAHGMASVPKGTKIVSYKGESSFMQEKCTMTIRCSDTSLRNILRPPKFSIITDEFKLKRLKAIDPSPVSHGELVYYERADWKHRSIPQCDIITDSSFTWAYISYWAGN